MGLALLLLWCENLQRKDLGRASEVKESTDALDAPGHWPVGPAVIPAGTMLTGIVGPDGELVVSPNSPLPPPLNATALDTDAAMAMLRWYPEELWHRLVFAPGIDRDAILAQARYNKRWPKGVPSQTTTQPISEAPTVVKEEKPRRPSRRR